jgi:H+/Cl- antiporter ClcA/CBS domain-containing protein
MRKEDVLAGGIPIALSLEETLDKEQVRPLITRNKRRLLLIAAFAVGIAVCISFIAKLLVWIIELCTNISFFGKLSVAHADPAAHHLGPWVIVIPAIGGLIVGLMALYGSKAIRGHGIPEAMEQILTNQSRIKPAITYLKPLSAAVSIGTGGPFGAEGPIIATGGALGSTLGQVTRVTHQERKILLAAGATAGMSAIFGSPIAAIFLAIELLLFEFSPRSIIPVALACITGAAGHHLLFEQGPVFAMKEVIATPGNEALAVYSIIGLVIGLLAVLITRIVYLIEDGFEHLPIHWALWPAIGGLAVGIIGYFAPRTLGVGYNNITDVLSGSLPLQVVLSLCLMKFLSWALALGSGTSGGTLAPLLTIGGATGLLIGAAVLHFFPDCGITLPLAGLIGMSAMFAGASRALLTSIVFALETTAQSNALLPLLAACAGAFIISFFLMENTIMTEKIARRGVRTPDSYEPDMLEQLNVDQVMQEGGLVLSANNTVQQARAWLQQEKDESNYFIITDDKGDYIGILSASNLFSHHHQPCRSIGELIKRQAISVTAGNSLKTAVELMAGQNIDVLPVVSANGHVIGLLSYQDVITAFKYGLDSRHRRQAEISLRRKGMSILVRGKQILGG